MKPKCGTVFLLTLEIGWRIKEQEQGLNDFGKINFTRTFHRFFGRKIMVGSRIIIAALMAILWSSISAHAHSQPRELVREDGVGTFFHLHAGSDFGRLAGAVSSSSQAVKSWIRRFSLQQNPGEAGKGLRNLNKILGWAILFGAGASVGLTRVLAQSWQFRLRTAMSARPPSLCS